MSSATGAQSYIGVVKANPANPAAIPATPVLQKVNFKTSDLGAAIDAAVARLASGTGGEDLKTLADAAVRYVQVGTVGSGVEVFNFDIPEPATMSMLAIGGLGILLRRRR